MVACKSSKIIAGNISIGYEAYQHDVGGTQEAWIDDVILDDTPIACP
jgi:hypothetical protein